MHIKISSTSITPQIVPKLAKNAKNVESKKNRPAANISKTVDLRKKFFFSKLISVKKYASACISKEKGELFFRSNMTYKQVLGGPK